MERESLIKELQEKEELKERTYAVYQQLIGQIALLRNIVERLDKEKVETPETADKK